eukprot:6098474-Pyramimonas_sp.AAC.1
MRAGGGPPGCLGVRTAGLCLGGGNMGGIPGERAIVPGGAASPGGRPVALLVLLMRVFVFGASSSSSCESRACRDGG